MSGQPSSSVTWLRGRGEGRGTLGGAVWALLVAPWVLAAPAVAQPTDWRVSAGGIVEAYSFSDPDGVGVEGLTLFSTPFAVRGGLGPAARVSLRGSFARGRLTRRDGSEATLAGLTDTEVRVGFDVVPGTLVAEAIGYLPTGSSTLDPDEAAVAALVAADILPLAVSRWGSAGAVAIALTGTRRFGALGLGIGASYRLSGSFDPLSDVDFSYEPGDELRVQAALDHGIGRSGRFTLSVGARRFGEDAGNGRNVFQTGDRLEVVTRYAFPMGLRSAGAVYGAFVGREEGSFLEVQETVTAAQRLFLGGAVVRLPLGSGHISPRADARLFRTDGGDRDGAVVGVGASMEVDVVDVTLIPDAGVRLGRIEGGTGADSGMAGFVVGVTVRFGAGGAS